MTIAFRVATSIASAANVNSVTLTIPGAVQVGDLMLASCFIPGPTNKDILLPTGWTLIRDDEGLGGGFHMHQTLFYKIAVSGDTGGAATVQFQISGGQTSYPAAILVAYSGMDPVTPIQAQGATGSSAYGTALTSPSVIATGPNTKVIEFFGASNSGGSPITLVSSATIRQAVADSSNVNAVSVSDQAQAGAGASGTQAATTAVNVGWVAQTLILGALGAANQPAAALI